MTFTLPDLPVTGTTIDTSWGVAVRNALNESAAAKAAANGDLFRATGASEIERFPSLGPGLLRADADAGDPAWLVGGALQIPRVNAAGNGMEMVTSPTGWDLIAAAGWTGTSLTISSLSGFKRYHAIIVHYHVGAGGGSQSLVPTLGINGLTANYSYAYEDKQYGASATTDGNATAAASIPLRSGTFVDATFTSVIEAMIYRPSVSGPVVIDASYIVGGGTAPQVRKVSGYNADSIAAINSIEIAGFSSLAANTGSHYAVFGSDS